MHICRLGLVGAVDTSVLQPTVPVFAAAISVALRLETLGAWKAVGIAASVAGAIAFTLTGSAPAAPPPAAASLPPGVNGRLLGFFLLIIQVRSSGAAFLRTNVGFAMYIS